MLASRRGLRRRCFEAKDIQQMASQRDLYVLVLVKEIAKIKRAVTHKERMKLLFTLLYATADSISVEIRSILLCSQTSP